MKRSTYTLSLLLVFLLATSLIMANDDRPESIEVLPKGHQVIIEPQFRQSEPDFKAALQFLVDELQKQLEAREIETFSMSQWETRKMRPVEENRSVAAVISLRLLQDKTLEKPVITCELCHFGVPEIKADHLRAPEYSCKFYPYSALLGFCSSEQLAQGFNFAGLFMATEPNKGMPAELIKKNVLLKISSNKKLGQGELQSIVEGISQGLINYLKDNRYSVIGIVPEKVKKSAVSQPLQLKVYQHIYDNEPPDYYATEEEKKEHEEKLKPKLISSQPIATEGCFIITGLEPVAPYHFELLAEGKEEPIYEGDFLTASIAGSMRTIPNELESYQLLSYPSKSEALASGFEELDYVITGATIIDGSGKAGYQADVGIAGEEIAKIGDLSAFKRGITIDGRGLFLTPGFIDIHNHSDRTIFKNPEACEYLRQGVTTVLGGNCSFSPLGLGAHLLAVEKQGTGVNYAMLIGNRPVRKVVIGWTDRQCTYDELSRMKELVDVAMEEGAFGMSTGLIYRASENAHTWELAELAKQLEPYGGFYASHIRGESDEVLDAAREAIFIGELAEVPVQISHIKCIGKSNWGKMKKFLYYVEQARQRGIDVLCDQYPYIATGGSYHYRLHRAITLRGIKQGNPDTVLFKIMPEPYKRWEGKILSEIMKEEGKTAEEIIEELELTPQSKIYGLYLCLCEEDLKTAMQNPLVMVCSDSRLQTKEALEKGDFSDTHPRAFGTYPEFLGKYVRDKEYCSWELGIYKCTNLPAQRMGLDDRGLIAEGRQADMVLFDPQEIRANNDYLHPGRPPQGVKYVFVNGQLALKEGKCTHVSAGKVLRNQSYNSFY